MTTHTMQPPKAVGLYDPRFEHDACGVGMVARLDNTPTHEVVEPGITALKNLEDRAPPARTRDGRWRGDTDADARRVCCGASSSSSLPAGRYGVLMCFLPTDDAAHRARCRSCSRGR